MLDLMKLNSFCLRNGIATDFFLLYFLYPTFFFLQITTCICKIHVFMYSFYKGKPG